MSDMGIFPCALCANALPTVTENAAASIPLPAAFNTERRVIIDTSALTQLLSHERFYNSPLLPVDQGADYGYYLNLDLWDGILPYLLQYCWYTCKPLTYPSVLTAAALPGRGGFWKPI